MLCVAPESREPLVTLMGLQSVSHTFHLALNPGTQALHASGKSVEFQGDILESVKQNLGKRLGRKQGRCGRLPPGTPGH